MTESVAFIKGFKTFEEAEQHLKTYLDPKPETMGIVSIHLDENTALYAITHKAALDEMMK